MKCPILIKVTKRWFRPPIYEPMDCLKEGCGWWDEAFDQCAILDAAQTLWTVRAVLTDIREKMPSAGQFTR